MSILAIDQGTSSTKALVLSASGEILGQSEVPVATRNVDAGGVEQDPEELWQSVLSAGRDATARAGVTIAALGLANQGETILAWDRRSGAACSPAISWQDRRAIAVCERLSNHAERLRAISGLPLDPYFVAPKMAWLREQVTTDGTCTTTDAWLLHRLTGAFVTDMATASRTLLLDLDSATWSAEACSIFGISAETLPALRGCAEVIGETTAFGQSIPVAGQIVDQQAALFAQSCFAAGEAKCTYGTGAFLLATLGARPLRSSAGLVSCVAWQLGAQTTYCMEGQVYTVGAALSWLQRIGLLSAPGELDSVGGQVADAGGVVFVPALAGLGAPFWRPAARATFVGLSLASERAHLLRAVIDGIACQVACLAQALAQDLGRPLTRLRVDGGLTRSRALMQAQADLLQVPVEVYPSPHATALGVAALARLGVGAAPTPADAVGRWAPAAIYEPRLSPHAAAARLDAWRRTVDAMSDPP